MKLSKSLTIIGLTFLIETVGLLLNQKMWIKSFIQMLQTTSNPTNHLNKLPKRMCVCSKEDVNQFNWISSLFFFCESTCMSKSFQRPQKIRTNSPINHSFGVLNKIRHRDVFFRTVFSILKIPSTHLCWHLLGAGVE